MGRMKDKRRREREAKQSREVEWWYEPDVEIEYRDVQPKQLDLTEVRSALPAETFESTAIYFVFTTNTKTTTSKNTKNNQNNPCLALD